MRTWRRWSRMGRVVSCVGSQVTRFTQRELILAPLRCREIKRRDFKGFFDAYCLGNEPVSFRLSFVLASSAAARDKL